MRAIITPPIRNSPGRLQTQRGIYVSPFPFPVSRVVFTQDPNTWGGGDLPWKQPSRKLRRARDKETGMLGLLIGAAALGGGFVVTRNFVRRRMRFVYAVRKPAAPLVAGLAATVGELTVDVLTLCTVFEAAQFQA